jgi:hypothetical protein
MLMGQLVTLVLADICPMKAAFAAFTMVYATPFAGLAQAQVPETVFTVQTTLLRTTTLLQCVFVTLTGMVKAVNTMMSSHMLLPASVILSVWVDVLDLLTWTVSAV